MFRPWSDLAPNYRQRFIDAASRRGSVGAVVAETHTELAVGIRILIEHGQLLRRRELYFFVDLQISEAIYQRGDIN
jgi:hypothetical protein